MHPLLAGIERPTPCLRQGWALDQQADEFEDVLALIAKHIACQTVTLLTDPVGGQERADDFLALVAKNLTQLIQPPDKEPALLTLAAIVTGAKRSGVGILPALGGYVSSFN
jgi:hypothetical protein